MSYMMLFLIENHAKCLKRLTGIFLLEFYWPQKKRRGRYNNNNKGIKTSGIKAYEMKEN